MARLGCRHRRDYVLPLLALASRKVDEGEGRAALTQIMDSNARRPDWIDFYARLPVWRSVGTWPRRDSFLLAGLLLFVDYLLVAIFIFASPAVGVPLAMRSGTLRVKTPSTLSL